MKTIETVDSSGRKNRFRIRDHDDPSLAQSIGIPSGVPDLRDLDWADIEVKLNNMLHDAGLFNWDDVMRSQDGVTRVVTTLARSVIRQQVIALYKQRSK